MERKDIVFLKKVEGLKLKPYKDTKGKLTIGYGRNLDDVGITESEAKFMLMNDVHLIIKKLIDFFGLDFWSSLPENVRVVLVSMVYNLGFDGFLGFKKFIEAIKHKNYQKAIYELQNSKRAKQLPSRTQKEVELLRGVL